MPINRRHLAIAGTSALGTLAFGTVAAHAAESKDDASVAAAVEAYRKGLLASNRAQLDAITANQLTYGHSSGRVQNKAEFLDGATDPKTVWKSIDLSQQSNKAVGNNALSRMIFTGENQTGGKSNSVHFGLLIVWVRQGGGWKMLARQGYKI